jgi:hypothetical protein
MNDSDLSSEPAALSGVGIMEVIIPSTGPVADGIADRDQKPSLPEHDSRDLTGTARQRAR